jgi:hypothetical protein
MLMARGDAALDAILDRELDMQAGLARIYAEHGLPAPPSREADGPDSGHADDSGQLQAVCDQIAMLESALTHASGAGGPSRQADMYLSAARRFLYELRTGLAGRTVTEQDAFRLFTSVRHDMHEADRTLREEQRLPVGADVKARLGEMRGLVTDLSGQLPGLEHNVMRLFGHSEAPAAVPVPQH